MSAIRRWWWIPLIALIGCPIKALVVGGMIQDDARDASVAALDQAGLGSAVTFDRVTGMNGLGRSGLNVALRGPAGDEAAAVAAVAARDEVDEVTYEVTSNAEAATTATTESEPTTTAAADAAPEPVSVTAQVAADGVVLTGIVPDETARQALVAAAADQYGAAAVTDQLEVVSDGYTAAGGTLTVAGTVGSEAEREDRLASAALVADAGGLELIDRIVVEADTEAESVNELNALFELEPIEFDVGRATIRPESTATLDRAATLINDNPDAGSFLVVGHTDSDGSETANQQLSEARARAVVTYLVDTGGVDAQRLASEGRGESEPVVDPELTQADKQSNRRITWESQE